MEDVNRGIIYSIKVGKEIM
uniref:Uncharacterized protein n=1 Tax=Lepeophtheirus salmonis TaxID=72036 RepID=A0A0K2UK14_LEPSM